MPLPAAITGIIVTGTYLAADGTPLAGTVSFVPSFVATTDGAIFPLAPVETTLDVDGAFAVELAATDDTSWDHPDFVYVVTEAIVGAAVRAYSIEVPAASAGGELDLSTVTPVAVPGAGSPYAADTAVVHLAGTETITGAKTFTAAVTVQPPTSGGHPTTKTYMDDALAVLVVDGGTA